MKHTLLIIDDDALILKTLKSRFSDWSTDVYSAGAPEEAKRIMEKVKPELVLLDLVLTRDDGAEDILDFMKTKPELEHVPVLVLTNMDTPDVRQVVLQAGAKEYLVKGSLSIDELYDKVMSYLEPVPKE